MTFARKEDMPRHPHRVTWGSPRVSQKVEGARENVHKGLYCGFHGKAWARHGKKA